MRTSWNPRQRIIQAPFRYIPGRGFLLGMQMARRFPGYDIAVLEKNLSDCQKNIDTYENIILREEDRARELRRLIALCKEREEVCQ